MTARNKVKGTAVPMPTGIALGVCLSLIITLTLAGLLAWLVLSGRTKQNVTGYTSMFIVLLATISGSLLSATKVKRRWMLVCCSTGVVYYIAMLASTALFFGGNYKGIGATGIIVLIGSIAAGMIGLKSGKGDKRKYRKFRSC